MRPDDPGAALRDIADHLPGMRAEVTGLHEAVRKSRLWIAVAVVIAVIAVGWTARQQVVLGRQQAVINHQQATIDAKSAAIDALVHQNAADAARDARNAHDLCVKLTSSRTTIVGVWKRVLSGRPGGAALRARVEAAEPLGACPKPLPPGS